MASSRRILLDYVRAGALFQRRLLFLVAREKAGSHLQADEPWDVL
jgi:hypothetical protein